MATNTRFPNGIETSDIKVNGALALTGNATVTGNTTVTGTLNATTIVGEVANKIDIDMVNAAYSLSAAEKKATYINVKTSTHAQTLLLGKAAGSIVVVTVTAATNTITVKNLTANTGTAVATGKTAIFVVTDDDLILISAIL